MMQVSPLQLPFQNRRQQGVYRHNTKMNIQFQMPCCMIYIKEGKFFSIEKRWTQTNALHESTKKSHLSAPKLVYKGTSNKFWL